MSKGGASEARNGAVSIIALAVASLQPSAQPSFTPQCYLTLLEKVKSSLLDADVSLNPKENKSCAVTEGCDVRHNFGGAH